MTQDQTVTLRNMLGEVVPVGGTEEDTLFTDEQLTSWINESATLDAAALQGWKIKMAHFANLVDTTDGAAARALSDLFAHAQAMVKMYGNLVLGPTAGRSRVGKIVRS